MVNKLNKKISKIGSNAKRVDPKKDIKNAEINIFLCPYFSNRTPAGIDINPYAMKNEKGRNPAMVSVNSKLTEALGFKAPNTLVKKEIIKKVRNTNNTAWLFRLLLVFIKTNILILILADISVCINKKAPHVL